MANNKPHDVLRDSPLKVTIWENTSSNSSADTFYTATLIKSYKDDKDQWKETTTLTGSEIAKGAKLLSEAAEKIKDLAPTAA